MTGSTSSSTTASTQIHAYLRTGILSGDFPAGAPLPSERTLSEQLGVGRHVVREAIKRLQQAGLVEVAQGGATRVKDWRTSGGLDVLADLARAGLGAEDWDHLRVLLRSMTEMRASVGADAARLAAQRATEAQRAELRLLAAQVAEPGVDGLERIERYEALWGAVLDASENIAYRLAYNSLILVRQGGLDIGVYDPEFTEPADIVATIEAIAAGKAEPAYALAAELLGRTAAGLAGDPRAG